MFISNRLATWFKRSLSEISCSSSGILASILCKEVQALPPIRIELKHIPIIYSSVSSTNISYKMSTRSPSLECSSSDYKKLKIDSWGTISITQSMCLAFTWSSYSDVLRLISRLIASWSLNPWSTLTTWTWGSGVFGMKKEPWLLTLWLYGF